MKFTVAELKARAEAKAKAAKHSLGQFAERNDVELVVGGTCLAVAVVAGTVAAKTTSTAVAVVGGIFAVSYGIGAVGAASLIGVKEFVRRRPGAGGTVVDGVATRVAA